MCLMQFQVYKARSAPKLLDLYNYLKNNHIIKIQYIMSHVIAWPNWQDNIKYLLRFVKKTYSVY